jgi:hypothetical protein
LYCCRARLGFLRHRRDWFTPLNPYKAKGPLFKIEDANCRLGTNNSDGQFEALYCYCISSKRYALFNLGKSGEIFIRKASAHGLGHLRAPYGPDDAPNSIPAPAVSLSEIGVERWHYVDRGRTERRHIRATGIIHIGKEANKWEEQFVTGQDEEAQIEYGADAGGDSLDERLWKMCEEFGQREAARRLGILRVTLAKAMANGCSALARSTRARITRCIVT